MHETHFEMHETTLCLLISENTNDSLISAAILYQILPNLAYIISSQFDIRLPNFIQFRAVCKKLGGFNLTTCHRQNYMYGRYDVMS
jgi:hypothetical protein